MHAYVDMFFFFPMVLYFLQMSFKSTETQLSEKKHLLLLLYRPEGEK